jgi:hypothetical protein
MKKFFILSIVIMFLSACAHFGVKEGKSGIFKTVETENNILTNDGGQGGVSFDLKKYTAGGEMFLGALVTYQYSGSGFKLRKDKGVKVSINGGTPFYLKNKIMPKHVVTTTQSGGGGHWMSTGGGMGMGGGGMMYISDGPVVYHTTTTEYAECYLSTKQLYDLLKAKSVEVTLIADTNDRGTPKTQAADFSAENFENLKSFYNGYLKNQGKAAN